MKIWISDIITPTYRQVRLSCEEHSDYKYLGDFDDGELKSFLLELQADLDADKNIKLIKYFGYIHLFLIKNK